MTKVTLTDLANLQNETTAVSTVNNNNATLETAFDNTLSRDGSSPNQMEANLDMNSFRILNLPPPTSSFEPLRVIDMALIDTSGITLSPLPPGGNSHQVLAKLSSSDYDVHWEDIFVNFPSSEYQNLASAAADHISPTTQMVKTLGRNFAGDNGGATYGRIPASTAAAWRFQSADGQWWALLDRIVTPEMFGSGDTADSTAAFAALSNWLNNFIGGGVVVNHNENASYSVWPGATAPSGPLVTLINRSGITWNFNGSDISCANTGATLSQAQVFKIVGCNALTFNAIEYIQTTWTTLDPGANAAVIYISDTGGSTGSSNIIINNMRTNGASIGVAVAGSQATVLGGATTKDIIINNAKFENTYYGLSFQAGGDNVTARGIVGHNTGRLYFPWNVSNHDVELITDGGGPFNNTLLKCYGMPFVGPERSSLSNIKVVIKNTGRINSSASESICSLAFDQFVANVAVSNAVNNGSGLLRLTVDSTANMSNNQLMYVNQIGGITGINNVTYKVTVVDGTHVDLQGSSSFAGAYTSGGYMKLPATIKNIEVKLDVNDTNGNQQPPAFLTYKSYSPGGVNDFTPSGYTLENLTVSGSLKNYNYGLKAIDMFNNTAVGGSTGDWTGENISNINLNNLTVSGTNSSVLINTTPVTNFNIQNVTSSSTVPWTVTGSNARVINSSVTGLTDARSVVPSAAVSNQFLTGVGADGAVTRAQPSVTNLSGLGTGVATALGVNVGTAGSPVVNGGALGTPTSGVASSLTTATAAVDTNTTQIASTAFVLAQAGSATPVIDGTGTVGTSTRFARQDHIHPTDTSRAAVASPTLTGTPAAPTAAVDTNTTQLATTAFVLAQSASATPLVNGTAVVGTSTRFARGDHVHPSDTTKVATVKPRVFTSTGTYTPSTGMLYCIIEGWGGGGAGGGAVSSGVQSNTGGGGGAGGYSRAIKSLAQVQADPSFSAGHVTVTIGAGGAGSSGANGANGSDTSVGSLMVAKAGSGGSVGQFAGGGSAGAGGIAGTGDDTPSGNAGGAATASSTTAVQGTSGNGGGTMLGGSAAGVTGASFAGNAGGTNTGGGGSGGANFNGGAAVAGGNGGSGYVRITEFCNQ